MNKPDAIAAAEPPLDCRVIPLPCPFCGEKSITVNGGSTFRWVKIECLACGATCGEVRGNQNTTTPDWRDMASQDAISEWNKRHNDKVTGAGTSVCRSRNADRRPVDRQVGRFCVALVGLSLPEAASGPCRVHHQIHVSFKAYRMP